MVNDCGNGINSTKFTICVFPEGNGYVKLACQEGTLPSKLTCNMVFEDKDTMWGRITQLTEALKKYEAMSSVEKDAVCKGVDLVCFGCNTAFSRKDATLMNIAVLNYIPTYNRTYSQGEQPHVCVVCPKCGSSTEVKTIK